MARTVVEKVARAHATEPCDRGLRAGDVAWIRPRHVLTHDNTAPVLHKFRELGGRRVADPTQPVVVLDHDIQNRSAENVAKYEAIERFAREQGIDFHPAGTGIGHQVIVERMYAVPGAFVVASDSHANMYGAVGAVGTPVVRTDAAAIWATGSFWWQVPPTVELRLEGALPAGSTGKDVILVLCDLFGGGEVENVAVEAAGPGVSTLTMDDRFAIANMSTEWGALSLWFPVDGVTIDWLRARRERLAAAARASEADLALWAASPPAPDPGADYVARITLDLSRVGPHVTGPDTVRVATPLAEIESRRIPIDKAYVVSCVNSRATDLAAAAAVLEGRYVAPGVELWISAASREVENDAREQGTWQTLLAAGARPLPPGCGPCIGLGAGLLGPGEVGISATNRNFKGRMGSPDAQCWLASPEVVAASAAAGWIRGPRAGPALRPERQYEERRASVRGALDDAAAAGRRVSLAPGFPRAIRGRVAFVPSDDLDTDAIFPGRFVYRDDTTPERMAAVAFAHHDPGFAAAVRAGDVLVGGARFGTGSSREQAVTALQALGIAAVVAGSFSDTYLRNALNNGFLCVRCPELVAWLLERLARESGESEGARARATWFPGVTIEIDFETATIACRDRTFPFEPPGALAQSLVAEGGIGPRIRRTLGAS
jgi:homoaconitate hydratase